MIVSPFLEDLKYLPNPKMILVGGTSASGKSTFINQHLNEYEVLDVDLIHFELFKTHNRENNLDKSIRELSLRVYNYILSQKSFVYPGTHAKLGTVLNRIIEAKEQDFSTAFIFLDISPELAYQRNQKRVLKGGHGKTISLEKIKTKAKYGKEVYDFFSTGKVQTESQKIDLERRLLTPVGVQLLLDFLYYEKIV
jgi:predicted ABC-type ATPase